MEDVEVNAVPDNILELENELPLSKQVSGTDILNRVKAEKERLLNQKRLTKRLYSRPLNVDQINKFLEFENYDVRLKRVGTEIVMFEKVEVDGEKQLVGYSLGHRRPTQFSMIQWQSTIDAQLKKIEEAKKKAEADLAKNIQDI